MYLLAHALDTNLRQNVSINGMALYNAILSTNFTGVTGQLTLDSKGDRALPVYDFLNLRPGLNEFTKVGSWDDVAKLNFTTAVIWPDGTTNVPVIDSVLNPPPVPPELNTIDYDDPIAIVLIILLMLLAIATFLVGVVLLFLLKTPVIKDSNVIYNYVLLASIFVACFTIYPYLHEANAALCGLRPWMTIGWFLVYGYVAFSYNRVAN